MADYRGDLSAPDAPSYLDTKLPLQPVKIVGAGIPKVAAKQRTVRAIVRIDATSRQYQIATNNSNTKYYFLGIVTSNNVAVLAGISVWDAISGTPSLPSAGNATTDSDQLMYFSALATIGDSKSSIYTFPIETKYGIRMQAGGAGVDCWALLVYIEERLD